MPNLKIFILDLCVFHMLCVDFNLLATLTFMKLSLLLGFIEKWSALYEYIHEHVIWTSYIEINPYGSHNSFFVALSHLSKNTFSYLHLEVSANCKGLSNIHHVETYFLKLMKHSYLYLYENNDFVPWCILQYYDHQFSYKMHLACYKFKNREGFWRK